MSTLLLRPALEAVIARLKAHTPLTSLVSQRIYGRRAPQGATFPYVVLSASATPWDTKSRAGAEVALRLQAFARGDASTTATKQADDILSAIYSSLHRQQFAVSGGSMLESTQNGLAEVAIEPDGKTAQAVLEVRLLVHE